MFNLRPSFFPAVQTAYTEITNFLQGHVENEANISPEGSCAGTCNDFVTTRHYDCISGSLCDPNENRHESAKCDGIIRNCDVIDNSDLTICEIVCGALMFQNKFMPNLIFFIALGRRKSTI